MRASTAFFVGIGTIGVATAAGLSGGFMIANMMNPKSETLATGTAGREHSSSPQSLPTFEPSRYVGASLAFIAPAVDGREPSSDRQADRTNAIPSATQAAAATPASDFATKPASDLAAKTAKAAAPKPATAEQEAAPAEQPSNPENAYAKARDADVKHAAAEKRRAERAQRWAERHRREQRDQDQDQTPLQTQAQNSGNSDQQVRNDNNSKSRSDQAHNDNGSKSRSDHTATRNARSYRNDRYSNRNDGGWAYSDNYSDRRSRDDDRPRYRDAERYYWGDREWRDRDDGPRPYDLPDVQLLAPE